MAPRTNGEDIGAGHAPTYLIPKMGEHAVSNTAFYTSLHITEMAESAPEPELLTSQIDPFVDLEDEGVGANHPAIGVLLTHEQGWFQDGLALGELLHSLCLAPGEVTKVAVIDWKRREAATDTSSTRQDESVSATGEQNLGTSEVQRAQARERQTGRSSTSSVATQSQAGGNVGFLFGGASASSSLSTSLGHSASMSTGSRQLAAESSREISQRTQQLSQATRSRRSTQVREVSQSESQSLSTRVVANYNRQHAMTVQYYEVLQVFGLKIRVAKAERCLFVPMKVMDFDDNVISDYRETLIAIASDLGFDDLREILLKNEDNEEKLTARLDEIEKEIARKTGQIKDRQAEIEAHKAERPDVGKIRIDVLTELGRLDDPRPGDEKKAATEGQVQSNAWKRQLETLQKAIETIEGEIEALKADRKNKEIAQRVSTKDLVQLLQRDRLVMNQLMWMRLDQYRVHRLLAAYAVKFGGEEKKLGGLVDPKPVGVFGNYVAFRWDFETENERAAWAGQFDQDKPETATVVLPSEGVFAEAVLGQSNSAEKIDVTRFWDWNGSPIPILPPDIAPLAATSRARDVGMADGRLEDSLASLPALQALPGLDLAAILGAVQTGSMFRNMSGLDQTVTMAATLAENSSRGAAEAGKTALDAQKAYSEAMVNLANSDAGKAAMQLAMTAVPGGKAATVLGGLMNAGAPAAASAGDAASDGNGAAPVPSGSSRRRRGR